jgi:hypothetical protein
MREAVWPAAGCEEDGAVHPWPPASSEKAASAKPQHMEYLEYTQSADQSIFQPQHSGGFFDLQHFSSHDDNNIAYSSDGSEPFYGGYVAPKISSPHYPQVLPDASNSLWSRRTPAKHHPGEQLLGGIGGQLHDTVTSPWDPDQQYCRPGQVPSHVLDVDVQQAVYSTSSDESSMDAGVR